MKLALPIVKRAFLSRFQSYRFLSSSVNNYNQLPTTCDPQSDVYKVFYCVHIQFSLLFLHGLLDNLTMHSVFFYVLHYKILTGLQSFVF